MPNVHSDISMTILGVWQVCVTVIFPNTRVWGYTHN